jgi:hypothetical protein
MSKINLKLVCILISILSINVLCQGNYGQTGNSQISTNSDGVTAPISGTNTINSGSTTGNTSTNSATSTSTTGTTNLFGSPNCFEGDSPSICITKPTCCHVTNQYGSYIYSACVDARSSLNFFQFCKNFYDMNAREGFYSNECICYGNFVYTSSSFMKIGYITLILILASILF